MKRNEKLLAASLVIMLVGYFAWPMMDSIFFAPIRDGEEKVAMLDKQVKDKQSEQTQLLVAKKRVAGWTDTGLPGDPLNAQRLYQQWLADLAKATGLDVQPQAGARRSLGNIYTSVQVTLKGNARFSEVRQFLHKFEQVDLLHRVSVLDFDSAPSTEGDPELPFQLTAEALNLKGAPDRPRLFPQIELAQPLEAGSTTLAVSKKSFPAKAGDLIRIGNEFATVVEVSDEQLTLERGASGSAVQTHPPGAIAELFPLKREQSPELVAFAKVASPFVKPRKYNPRFEGFNDQKLVRGNRLQVPLKLVDFDESAGTPEIKVTDHPGEVTYDATSGVLTWNPPADAKAGPYTIAVAAEIPTSQKRIEKAVQITLVEANQAPQLEPIPATEVFLGETARIPLKASDPDDGSKPLSLKVEQGPEGASIDSAKGEFAWSVPASFSPGEVSVEVSAVDQGDPPLSARQKFTIKVLENLKPYVKLVSTIDDGGRSAWLWNQAEGQRVTLSEGQPFEVAGMRGVTKEIGARYVVYERGGEMWRLELGSNLEQAEKTGSVPVSSEVEPVEADQPEAPAESGTPKAAKFAG